MLREMGEVLDRSGERRPLLLVTEDLHWGDRATIQLIDYVARRRGSGGSCGLQAFVSPRSWRSTIRSTCCGTSCACMTCARRSSRSVLRTRGRRLRGGTIASDRQRRSVRARVARAHRRIAAIHRIRHERDERARRAKRRPRCPEQVAKIAVPENLAAIIEHYIAKLENDQRTLLSAAAVCGVQFRVNTIASALERDAAWVE
jgi:hypothetical protein